MAYRAPEVLAESLRVYAAAGWDTFIHLDAKADLAAYRSALGDAADLCWFTPRRTAIFWGGYSMMRAEMDLIAIAREVGPYERYLLISDDSLPIRTAIELREMMNVEVDRISVLAAREGSTFWNRYWGWFYFDHDATQPRGGSLHQIDDALIVKMDELKALRRRGKHRITVFHGSQFWCITAATVDAVVRICDTDPFLCRSFEFAALPDELMFQSICGNFLGEGRSFAGSPVWADFSRGHGPLTYSSEGELPNDLDRQYAFVRKADPKAAEFLANHCVPLLKGAVIPRRGEHPAAGLTGDSIQPAGVPVVAQREVDVSFVISQERPDLGGNFRHGDIHTIAPRLWRYMIDRFGIDSVLDVGCGEGHAVRFFRRLGLHAHGIDGLVDNVRRAVIPIALHDLLSGPYYMPVDLVWSCEVAEHIDPAKVGHYLDTLACGRIVAMTHALPGQEGYHHVNCQPPEYWIEKMRQRGFVLDPQNQVLREVSARDETWNYFAKTGLVFHRNRES
jgi:hypothetical protein